MRIDGDNIIELNSISFKYEGNSRWILRDISLSIGKNDIALLLGKSGSGKTTIARIITGLIPHFYKGELKGEAYVNGYNIKNTPIHRLSEIVGLIRQNPENQILMTKVEREIAFSLEFLDIDRGEMKRRVFEIANKLGIKHLLNRDIESLSGGELQKVAIASILVRKPKIIILDEPSAYLSPSSVKILKNIILDLNREGITFMIIDHRLDYWLDIGSKIFVVDDGAIVYDGDTPGFINFLEKEEHGLNIPLYLRLALDVKRRCGLDILDFKWRDGGRFDVDIGEFRL